MNKERIWKLLEARDQKTTLKQCRTCGKFESDNSRDKMTIGHINLFGKAYKKFLYTDRIENLMIQCFECNRTQGSGFKLHTGARQLLGQILKENIEYEYMLKTRNVKKVENLQQSIDSENQNKNKVYRAYIESYLKTILASQDHVLLKVTSEEIAGIVSERQNGKKFGSPVSVERNLRVMCNRFSLKYIIEDNSDGEEVIRKQTESEVKKNRQILDTIHGNKEIKVHDRSFRS